MDLYWLPTPDDWHGTISGIVSAQTSAAWQKLQAAAWLRLDATQTAQLDRILTNRFGREPPSGLSTRPIRLAILSSTTVTHLVPAIRVAALRHGIWVHVYTGAYGAYSQEILDFNSPLHEFRPDVILFAFDSFHLTSHIDSSASTVAEACEPILESICHCWRQARKMFGCRIIQQTPISTALALIGSNEHRLSSSSAAVIQCLNHALRAASDTNSVDLLAIDALVMRYGIDAWHDAVWWLRAKQEIKIAATPCYGESVARLLAASQGLSRKCVVLDLDNTIWGGIIGDDGLSGIVLGQGSAEGEAYVAFQNYLRNLTKRGVILAVVSKNDEVNALEAVESHPEMVLKRNDFVAFVANWDDKVENLRRVVTQLGIGLDSLVFVDDNPFERDRVRTELPTVAVPEMPEDPAFYARTLADAGYFEALSVTEDDRFRTAQYAANAKRSVAAIDAVDLSTYLAGLRMRLSWKPFDQAGLSRIVQLINKTNQFNLTTKRATEEEVVALMVDKSNLCLQFRLLDKFGDNGMIGVVIGRKIGPTDRMLDIWLMSCRVLGRQVENAMLNIIAERVTAMGDQTLFGLYRRSAKNGMVEDLYDRLGFERIEGTDRDMCTYRLDLNRFEPASTFIVVEAS